MFSQVAYAKMKGLGGIMFWTMDFDDFKGKFCAGGHYPLLKAAKHECLKGSGKGEIATNKGEITTNKDEITTNKGMEKNLPFMGHNRIRGIRGYPFGNLTYRWRISVTFSFHSPR